MTKPAPIPFKPLNFEATAAAVEKLAQSENIPALRFPQEQGRAEVPAPALVTPPVVPKPSRPKPSSPTTSKRIQRFPVALPVYVLTAIKQRALEAETTSRFIIMEALRKSGIPIADDDMIEDGRRVR